MLFVTLLTAGCAAQLHEGTPKTPEAPVAERIAFIQDVLDQGQANARLWFEGWLYGQGILAAGQAIVAVKTSDQHLRQDMLLGASEACLGVIALEIDPMVSASAADQLRAIPGQTAAERERKLFEAERLLRQSAEREQGGTGWMQHVFSAGVCAAGATLVALVWKRSWTDGLIDFSGCMAGAEAQTLSQPTRAIDDWAHYQSQYLSPGGSPTGAASMGSNLHWFLMPFPGGLAAAVSF